ncbi:MAG: hypothetical protein HY901_22665 [Deltaproteobacteria bacterium]|nr:hypothetical protein [Deltaproteobacteria bacterium]
MQPPLFGAGGPWAESVALPRDVLGYVRRECPECHRLFKVKGTPLEGMLVFARLASQVTHANREEADWPEVVRFCPYCGFAATDERWFTAEQRAFLDKRGEVLEQELRFEQLAHVERTLSVNPGPTFLPVRPERLAATLAAEPNDMRVLPLFCCHEEIKVSEGWLGAVRCFFCGTEHELGAALLRDRLSRILS